MHLTISQNLVFGYCTAVEVDLNYSTDTFRLVDPHPNPTNSPRLSLILQDLLRELQNQSRRQELQMW
jgi:hypothetical protein